MQSVLESWKEPKRILVILAHPDDPEFFCGATIARWTDAGHTVVYWLLTCGDKGAADPDVVPSELCGDRRQEQRNAAAVLGVHEIHFLDYPDGYLIPDLALRKDITRIIRKERPDVLVTCDPKTLYVGGERINHPDHRAAATAALDAVFPAAGQPNLFEELAQEGLTAHKPRKVYVTVWEKADLYVNIEETIDLKIAALRAHKSQMRDWDPEKMIRTWAAEMGRGKEMDYAEGFRVVTLVDDETWAKNKNAWGEGPRQSPPA